MPTFYRGRAVICASSKTLLLPERVPAILAGFAPSASRSVVFFYSAAIALRSPSTVRPIRANVSRWMARASASALGSVTILKMAQRAAYSSRTSTPVCLITAASSCVSAMFCACRVLIRSMSRKTLSA